MFGKESLSDWKELLGRKHQIQKTQLLAIHFALAYVLLTMGINFIPQKLSSLREKRTAQGPTVLYVFS